MDMVLQGDKNGVFSDVCGYDGKRVSDRRRWKCGKISTSLVNDIIMPLISMLTGGIDFSNWKIVLKQAVAGADGVIDASTEVAVRYGTFLATILDFLIIAFAVFLMIKTINGFHDKMKKQEAEAPAEPPAPPEPSAEEKLLTEIRDLLKEQK